MGSLTVYATMQCPFYVQNAVAKVMGLPLSKVRVVHTATGGAFGGKEEVSDYCKKLIEIVGKDGGFILGAGCEVAPNARPENVKAMIDAVKRFGYYC